MGSHTITFDNAWSLFEAIYANKGTIGNHRRYSSYAPNTRRTIVTVARGILNVISGADTTNLLNDLLRPMGVAKLYPFDKVI